MRTTQTTTVTKTMPKLVPKPQRQPRPRAARVNQVMTKIVNSSANVAAGTTVRNGPGAKMNSNGNVTRVQHREFIADISSNSSAFATTTLAINPGNPTAFPWLAAIATNYESYTFKKLAYRYLPLCPTSTQGRITMAIDYDARDTVPTTKAVLSQYQGAVATPVWQQGLYVSTPANLTKFCKQRYVSGPSVPTNSDVKTYHVGQFTIATSNTPASLTQLGELWVEYDVELQTPQIATSVQATSNTEKVPVSGGAQRTKIGIRNGLPVLDVSFTDEIHNVLGSAWDYVDGLGQSRTKFSLLLNKYLNHPVLYLIKYGASSLGPIKIVRPANVNTGFFAPSFRQRGTSEQQPQGEYSSIDLTPKIGIGISDPLNDGTIGRRFLAFIAHPQPLISGDASNVASQLQFSWPKDPADADSVIDIQTFSLPAMQNNDTSNSVNAAVPAEGGNFDTNNNVETINWLRLAQILPQSAGTLRQIMEADGTVKFKSVRKLLQEETSKDERDTVEEELSTNLLHAIEDVITRLRSKNINTVEEQSDE